MQAPRPQTPGGGWGSPEAGARQRALDTAAPEHPGGRFLQAPFSTRGAACPTGAERRQSPAGPRTRSRAVPGQTNPPCTMPVLCCHALRAFSATDLFVFPEVTSLLAPGGSTGAARSVQGRVRGAAGGREDAWGSGTLGRRCSRCPPASLPAPFPSSHPFSHVADVHEQG